MNGYMPAAAMPLPGGYGAAPAPYPQGAMPAQPAMQYNQGYGYAPAAGPGGMPAQATGVQMPNGGISMVNNVTVSQATPAPAPQPQASSTSTRVVIVQRADRVGVLLRALALLIVNGFAGALWVGAADTNSYNTGSLTALALIVTILVLLFDIYVLDRLSRRP